MKAHRANRVITENEVKRLAYQESRKVVNELVDDFLQSELPKIEDAYAKLILLSMAGCKGIGKNRMREVMRNLGEATCEMHNLMLDDVFDEIYDKRLKEQGLWEIYEVYQSCEIVPMFEGSKYLEVKRE